MHFRGPSGRGCSFQRANHSDAHVLLCNKTKLCATAYITCSLRPGTAAHISCRKQMQQVQCHKRRLDKPNSDAIKAR